MTDNVKCSICGQTGSHYFFGHDDKTQPHPWLGEVYNDKETDCKLCGLERVSFLHNIHQDMLDNLQRRAAGLI